MTHDIVIQGLVKDYGNLRALDHIDLNIPSGAALGLIGPNGAGKTTFFSLLANFIKPTQGKIEILGHSISQYHQLYGKIGILPQDSLLYRHQSIYKQLVYFSRILGANSSQAKEEAEHVLELVNLTPKKHAKASTLSHGMSKRLGIAQALLGSPQILLLDEPLAGLDPPLALSMRQLILSLKKDRTLIISSHNLKEIEEVCDHVAILNAGQLKVACPLEEIMQKGSIVQYHLESEPNLEIFLQRPEIERCQYNAKEQCLVIHYHEKIISLPDLNQWVIDILRLQSIGLLQITTGQSLEASILQYLRA